MGTGDEVAGVGASAAAWHTTSKLLAYLRRGTYTECTLDERDKSLKDSLVRAIIHSLNLNNSNGVIYGEEGDNITIIKLTFHYY